MSYFGTSDSAPKATSLYSRTKQILFLNSSSCRDNSFERKLAGLVEEIRGKSEGEEDGVGATEIKIEQTASAIEPSSTPRKRYSDESSKNKERSAYCAQKLYSIASGRR